jgi:CheY-like chemotaxis protein
MIPLIMCIDDDSMVQMLSEIIFSDQHFCKELVKAPDGFTALQYFEEQSKLDSKDQQIPKLVFLDISMPISDGWDFLEKITTNFPDIQTQSKIIVLSSAIHPEEVEKANAHPLVYKYISKPLEAKHLLELKLDPDFSAFFTAN